MVFLPIISSLPYSPSQDHAIIQSPTSTSLRTSGAPVNVTTIFDEGWPSTPWTYHDGPEIVKFQEYGDSANATFTKDIIRATLNIETDIYKGAATYKEGSWYFQRGPVNVRFVFTGQGQVTMGEIFRIVDQWRVYAGIFGAKEIRLGEIGPERPWTSYGAFMITFDNEQSSRQSGLQLG